MQIGCTSSNYLSQMTSTEWYSMKFSFVKKANSSTVDSFLNPEGLAELDSKKPKSGFSPFLKPQILASLLSMPLHRCFWYVH